MKLKYLLFVIIYIIFYITTEKKNDFSHCVKKKISPGFFCTQRH